jgi:nitroimidazol reductase NimA-like FMN-containing flavoprotein (pyridoxamine 5'-phosphate oxidase superfamily)
MADQRAPASERVTVKRFPQRGVYDRAAIDAILDEGLICHVGFTVDSQPFVIPTIYARDGDRLYFHGSQASRMLRALRGGIAVCVTVTLLDGLVLARSAFNHSMNYRSVVVLGTAVEVADPAAKLAALKTISDHVIPGRWEEVRPPNDSELAGTSVLAVPIAEASAKIRRGPPMDDEVDYALPVWAGQLPLKLEVQAPIADARLAPSINVPGYIANYRRPRNG